MAAVLGVDRVYLLGHPEQVLTQPQADQFEAWVTRCANGEPLAYILGRRAFYDRELIVSPAVLVPRSETEHLLQAALDFMRLYPNGTAVDVGTGSGALATTLAAHLPNVSVYATDISPEALAVARQNAVSPNVQFFQGDLLTPLIERGITVDVVMANLPYIPSADVISLPVSQHEPHLALDGGTDGLDLIRHLLSQAPSVCNPHTLILLEIGSDQGLTASTLAKAAFPDAVVTVLPDLAGLDRVVQIQR